MAKDIKVVSTDESTGLAIFEIPVKDRDKETTTTFQAPKDAPTFKRWVAGLTGETLEAAYKLHMYAADLKARAAAREGTGAVKPEIVVKGVRINLVTGDTLVVAVEKDGKLVTLEEPKAGPKLGPAKRAAMINAALTNAEAFGTEPPKAILAAREELVSKHGWTQAANGHVTAKAG